MVLVIGALAFLFPCVLCAGEGPVAGDYGVCDSCHKGIEKISDSHNLTCIECHVPPELRGRPLKSHSGLVRNPSSPQNMRVFCLPCHRREIEILDKSLHSTMAGIINQTRYLWGAQGSATPALYGLSGPLKSLPDPGKAVDFPNSPKLLVDDFLRRRCLRCHIGTRGQNAYGLYRASGCAACHVVYGNDGGYRGEDRCIDSGKTGYPARHRFSRNIPTNQCLHCHNHNHVGTDYKGLFEHDYHRTYRSLSSEGVPLQKIYGMDYHHLAPDIHFTKGLICTDCHHKTEIMGDGNMYSYSLEVPGIKCIDCHGGFNSKGREILPNIKQERGILYFYTKTGQKRLAIKIFCKESPSHDPRFHSRVRCSACHAQWSYQDYGLSVIREDVVAPNKWYGLEAQGDPYLEAILSDTVNSNTYSYPISFDWITHEQRPGIWSIGWRFRRWEYLPLGIDNTGRYTVIRPKYQFLVSYVNKLGTVVLDSVVPERGDRTGNGWAYSPYVPHTTGKIGRSCDSCHGNHVGTGDGVIRPVSFDTGLAIPSQPAIKSMRLLTSEEKEKLMKPSSEYHKARLKCLKEGNR